MHAELIIRAIVKKKSRAIVSQNAQTVLIIIFSIFSQQPFLFQVQWLWLTEEVQHCQPE